MKTRLFLFLLVVITCGHVFAQPVNDSCSTATALMNVDVLQNLTADLLLATESLDASCETSTNINRDVWFSFVMPFDGKLKLSSVFGSSRISFFDACGGSELDCWVGNGFLDSLASGVTYYLRYSSHTPSLQTDNFTLQAFPNAPNDDCVNAIAIGDISTSQTIALDTREGNESLDSSCETASQDNYDLWYSFLMPFDGKVKVSGGSVVNRSVVFDACGGTELGCIKGNGFFNGLVGGTSYILRLASPSNNASASNIPIQAFAPPSNDDCANAILVTNIDVQQTLTFDTRGANESLDASCETASNDNLDIWYSFTMPFDGKIKITGPSAVKKTVVYGSCGGAEIDCIAAGGFIYGLIGGTTYLMRYASPSQNAANESLTLQAFAPPANDECTNPDSIGDISTQQTLTFNTQEATESLDASCETASNDNLDVWFTFLMPFNGKVRIDGSSAVKRTVLYDSCGGSELDCLVADGFFFNLNGGITYLMRYASISQNAANETITIEAFAAPSNDECTTPDSIADITVEQFLTFDTQEATESLDASCETASNDNLDLWFTFKMPFDGKIKIEGSNTVKRTVLYDSCGGTELDCLVGNGFIYGLTGGIDYLMRYASPAQNTTVENISIQAFPPPLNDECIFPDSIGDITTPQSIVLDTREASETLDASCEDAANQNFDLWYTFTMPFDGKVQVTGVFGFNKTGIYDGCGGTELGCMGGSGFFQGLDSGVSYLFRYAAIAPSANKDSFAIQAFLPPANDKCDSPDSIGDISTKQSISVDTREATESLDGSCDDAIKDNLDLWYTFVMPYDGDVFVDDVINVSSISVFDSCGGTEFDCKMGGGFFYGLASGTPYLLRYSTVSASAGTDQFTVEAFPPLLFDECTDPFDLGDISQKQVITADTRQATQSLIASCEDSTLENLDLWYTFEMPFDGRVKIDELAFGHTATLFDSCGGMEILCLADTGIYYGLDSGFAYFLRYAATNLTADLDSFSIQAFAPPPNDACTNPDSLKGLDTLITVYLDTREATESMDASCEDILAENLDFWYTFTMPYDGSVEVSQVNDFHTITLMDSCTGTELGCFLGNSSFFSLETGRSYLLRYASPNEFAGPDSFDIQANMALAINFEEPNLENLTTKKSLTVFPNPAQDRLFLSGELADTFGQTEVYDLTGRKLMTLSIYQDQVDVTSIPAGSCVFFFISNDQVIIRRITLLK